MIERQSPLAAREQNDDPNLKENPMGAFVSKPSFDLKAFLATPAIPKQKRSRFPRCGAAFKSGAQMKDDAILIDADVKPLRD